jgi:hypothetical protein
MFCSVTVLHVPLSNLQANETNQAARCEHALRLCIFGVENAYDMSVNL